MDIDILKETLNAETSHLLGVMLAMTAMTLMSVFVLYMRETRKLVSERSSAEKSQRGMILELTRISSENFSRQAEITQQIAQVIQQNSDALLTFKERLTVFMADIDARNTTLNNLIAELPRLQNLQQETSRVIDNLNTAFGIMLDPIETGIKSVSDKVNHLSENVQVLYRTLEMLEQRDSQQVELGALREMLSALQTEIAAISRMTIGIREIFERQEQKKDDSTSGRDAGVEHPRHGS